MEEDASERLCDNCGVQLKGPYCHACGQKYQQDKHSFFHLLYHFASDFVHFDAQLFTTLKPLFTKPGLVPKDYVEGKRKRHLDPIRMYIFVSIVFFALFFSVSKIDRWKESGNPTEKSKLSKDLISMDDDAVRVDSFEEKTNIAIDVDSILDKVNEVRKNGGSSLDTSKLDTIPSLKDSTEQLLDSPDMYRGLKRSIGDPGSDVIKISNWEIPKNQDKYLADQEALPKNERDGWIKKNLVLKIIHLNASAKEDEQAFWLKLLYQFVKSLPKLLFILLPFFALILKLLYIRRSIYYVDHLIFMIYFFCFIFIVYSIAFIIQLTLDYSILGWIYLWIFFYLYFAMRRFYGQSRLKTIAKFFLFGYLSTIVALIGAVLGALVSVLFI